jgi:hypothetical protein
MPVAVQDGSRPTNRLQALGYRAMRRKPEDGPKELTARHLLLIEYMVHGRPHNFVAEADPTSSASGLQR